jgi:hypothetical protein
MVEGVGGGEGEGDVYLGQVVPLRKAGVIWLELEHRTNSGRYTSIRCCMEKNKIKLG